MQVSFLGRAPRTKETLPDFLKWRRVTRPPLVFRGLTGSQRTPGFWGVTLHTRSIKNFRTSSVRIKSNGQRIYSVLDIFGSVFRFSSGSLGPVHNPSFNNLYAR